MNRREFLAGSLASAAAASGLSSMNVPERMRRVWRPFSKDQNPVEIRDLDIGDYVLIEGYGFGTITGRPYKDHNGYWTADFMQDTSPHRLWVDDNHMGCWG